MIWSKYNFLYKSKKHNVYLLYNSLSNSFLKLDNDIILTAIIKIKEDVDNFDFTNKEDFFKLLKKSKIILDSDETEILKIKNKILLNRYSPYNLTLTLLPTLACNFNCPYCFVKESNIFMDDFVENKIIMFIQKQIIKHSTLINLTWMGGEPLLNFKRIRSLTQKIQSLEAYFKADLITNGYLLTREKINELQNLSIKLVQVTIDGYGDTHDKTRIHKSNKKSFSKIINNIDTFFSIFNTRDTIGLNVRINLLKEENYLSKFFELYSFLKERYPFENLYITPGFVQDSCHSGNNMDCDFNRGLINNFYLELIEKYKITEYSNYPKNEMSECAVKSIYTSVIGPSAELYTCWDYIGNNSKSVGYINNDGISVITDENLYYKYITGADYLNDAKCLDCFYLPICFGGCPEKRVRNFYNGTNLDNCCIQKDNLEEILDSHYTIKYSH